MSGAGARPPRVFEGLLRRAGRHTVVGAGAVEDLRREYAGWRGRGGRLRAHVRYAVVATALAVRLYLEGWGQGNPARSGGGLAASILQDVRIGVRGLARSPVFTMVAGATFAVGIGATTAVFAVVSAVLLAPLPYAHPDRLVKLSVNTGGEGWYGSSVPEYLDYEERLSTLEGVAAYGVREFTMGDSLAPVRVSGVMATASLLPLLGVEPMLGRVFTAGEDRSDDNRYVVLSHALWREAYGADPGIVGSTVPLSGLEARVLGVMPPGFAFPDPSVRVWLPAAMNRDRPSPRNNHFLEVIGRLADGATIAQARSQLAAYAASARAEHPETYGERGFRTRLEPLHEAVVGEVRAPLVLMLSAAVLVLLIACANVANLVLTRAEARRRELGVRASLGASQPRLVRQLATESLLLSALGGALGLGVAVALLRLIVAAAPPDVPRIETVALSPMVLLGALVVIAGAGLLSGTLPAVRATRHVRAGALARTARGTAARGDARGTRRVLVASQVALATIIAVAAGLMLRTLHNLRSVPLGFTPENALVVAVTPDAARYAEVPRRAAFWQELTQRLTAIPGVEAAGATSALPLSNGFDYLSIRVEGRVTTSIGDAPDARVQRVTPGLFEALGIGLLEGRYFDETDRADGRPVVIVSRSFAQRFWPGRDAIGRQMRVFAEGYPWLTVVGVVEDILHDRLDAAREPMWYVPHAQAQNAYGTPLHMFAVVRTAGAPTDALPAVRQAVRELDPTAPLSHAGPLEDRVRASIAGRAFTFDLLGAFCAAAVFLAGIGLHGVLLLSVGERRAEIGMRRVLGADRGAILRLVLRESMVTVGAGIVAGLLASLGMARIIEGLLFGVEPLDPAAIAASSVLVAVAALIASALPAMLALRIEPAAAIEAEG